MGVKYGVIGILCAVTGLSACQTTQPAANSSTPSKDVTFVMQNSRPDWKEQIDEGVVGFYDPAKPTLIGLDTPPHTKGHDRLAPVLEMSDSCRQYVQEHGKQIIELEFLISEEGEKYQFYPLKSAGPCDQDVAKAIQESTILPAQKDGQPQFSARTVIFRPIWHLPRSLQSKTG